MKDDRNEEIYNRFCEKVKFIMKECNIKYDDMCQKLKIKKILFTHKINHNQGATFNLYQVLQIAKELDESVEYLCSDKWEIIK